MDKIKARQLAGITNLQESVNTVQDSRFSFFTRQDTNNTENRNILKDEQCIDFTDYSVLQNKKGFYLINLQDKTGQPNPDDITAYKNWLESKTYHIKNRVAVDLETTGVNYLEDEIVVLAFSDGYLHGYINLDINRGFNTAYQLLQCLSDFEYECIAFNVQFENAFISHHFGIQLNWVDDPQVCAYLHLNKPYPKLGDLASEILNRFPKTLEEISGEKFNKDMFYKAQYRQEICLYCCEDCYETLLLADHFEKSKLYHIDLESTLVASKMKLRGVSIDNELLSSLPAKIEAYIEILMDEIEVIAGYQPNLKSSQQMNKLLFDELQLDPSELTPNKSGYSLNDKARQLLLPQHPIIQKIDNVIKAIDIRNKYVNSLIKQIYFGKIHTTFNTIVTSTGRLSSSNPNLQQIPNPDKYASYDNYFLAQLGKDIRNLFIADEGYTLIACDFSSFELRILAHLCKDPVLIDVFHQGNSLHNVMTEKLFGIKYDKNNPDHKAKRTVVKTINFGLIYGMTWIRLFEECKLRGMKWSKNDCKNIIEQYWEMLPVLSEWFARLKIKAIQQGYTETMFGRRRYYSFSTDVINYCKNANTNSQTYKKLVNSNKLTPNDESQLRQAGNAVIQGTNADAIRVAMQLCDNIKGVELLLQIHDELVFQVPKGLEKYAKQQIKDTMESSIALDVPVIAEPVEAKRWGEAK